VKPFVNGNFLMNVRKELIKYVLCKTENHFTTMDLKYFQTEKLFTNCKILCRPQSGIFFKVLIPVYNLESV
jgi:hypothetical protein